MGYPCTVVMVCCAEKSGQTDPLRSILFIQMHVIEFSVDFCTYSTQCVGLGEFYHCLTNTLRMYLFIYYHY